MQTSDWPTVIRHVHLKGGLRALNKPGKNVLVFPTAQRNTAASFELSFYGHLLPQLLEEKLGPFGIDYFETVEQIEGVFPPSWKLSNQQEYEQDVSIEQLWSNVARRAVEEERTDLAELAGRLSFGYIASKRRLRDLSDAYHNELRSLLFRSEFEPLYCFVPSDPPALLLAITALFGHISQMTEDVGRFVSMYVYPGAASTSSDTLTGVRATVRERLGGDDAFAEDLWRAIEQRSSDGADGTEGWLARAERYRSAAVQLLPVARATPLYLMISGQMGTLGENVLPGVNCFLPESREDVERARRTGALADVKRGSPSAARADALGVAFESVSRLIELGFKLVGFAPSGKS